MWHDYVGKGVDLQTYQKYASKQLLMLALHIVIVFFMIIIYFYFKLILIFKWYFLVSLLTDTITLSIYTNINIPLTFLSIPYNWNLRSCFSCSSSRLSGIDSIELVEYMPSDIWADTLLYYHPANTWAWGCTTRPSRAWWATTLGQHFATLTQNWSISGLISRVVFAFTASHWAASVVLLHHCD